jgi:hypothetical protein
VPRVIDSFAPRKVVHARPSYRTERYVSRLRVHERILELISSANETRHRRYTPVELTEGKRRLMRKLEGELGGDDPLMRILGVVEWYEANCGRDERLPWVEDARSLYDKFSRLEKQMEMRTRDDAIRTMTVDDVVGRAFNGSRVLAASFRHDVLGSAKELDLGGASEVDLAASLAAAYAGIERAREGRYPDGVPSPLELLRRYVDWLSEKSEWRMTTRVLSLESPAFSQFIREETARHPREVDPLTGRN